MMPALKSVRQSSVPSGGEICQAFIDDDSSRQVVSEVLGEQSGISAAIETGGVAAALRQLKPDSSPRLLIVDIAEGDDAASDIAALMSVADPSTRVIAIGGVNDISLFRDLLAVGVADYVVKPIALAEWALGRGFRLDGEVIAYLLSRGRRDMPSLVGALEELDRRSLALKRPITVPMLRDWLQRSIDERR